MIDHNSQSPGFERVYDVDMGEMADSPSLKKRRKRQAQKPESPVWKVITVFLLISSLGLWAFAFGIYRQLGNINRALGQYEGGMGSFLIGQESFNVLSEPTEEDSIRQWESLEASEEHPKDELTGMRKVYLTFDDGPSRNTGRILDILNEYGVKATFFVVGQGKDVFRDDLKRIVDEGHTLGMHSYSHVYKDIYSSREAYIQDLNKLQDYIHEVTGIYPDYYRFPGGSSTGLGKVPVSELEGYLTELDLKWYDWNISSGDATGRLSADQIFKNSTSKLENFSEAVILFHDAAEKDTTVEALPHIIEYILSMEDTIIVPISKDTSPVIHRQ